jgi:hypothetical protein
LYLVVSIVTSGISCSYRLSIRFASCPLKSFPQQEQIFGFMSTVCFISPFIFNPCPWCPNCPPGFFPLFFLSDVGDGLWYPSLEGGLELFALF